MCSIEEGDLEEVRQRELVSRLKNAVLCPSGSGGGVVCQKCRTQPAVLLLRVNDIYCRQCFLAAVTHKFRSTLGKWRQVRPGEPTLVAFSGGRASSVLARLIRDGLDQPPNKRLRLAPLLLHVQQDDQLGEDHLVQPDEQMMELAEQYGLPVYHTELALSLTDDLTAPVATPATEQLRVPGWCGGQLRRLLAGCGSDTSRLALLHQLRADLLVRSARQLGCRLLLLADTETHLAIRLISDLAEGRGSQVQARTGFCDQRYGDVLVLRPLREISGKEVALFAHHAGVRYHVQPNLTTRAPVSSSIWRASEAFIQGLQAEFPATVSTVFRTGNKLSSNVNSERRCALCRLPLDTEVGAASALQARRFSQLVSASGPDTFIYGQAVATSTGLVVSCSSDATAAGTPAPPAAGCESAGREECCGGAGSCGAPSAKQLTREALVDQLCYGCQLIVRDLEDLNSLPRFVVTEAEARTRREHMRKEIEDFLISDD